jgi:predicted sulfurtransferase
MKKIISFFAIAFSFLTLSACAAPAAAAAPTPTATPAEYRKISAKDAKARMDSGDEIIILDVRTQKEFDAGHIKGAILVPNETIIDKQPKPVSYTHLTLPTN